jgi:hypothetical protein
MEGGTEKETLNNYSIIALLSGQERIACLQG